MLAERLCERGQAFAEAWNFGPSDEDARPVQWIVERLCRAWGRDAQWSLQPGQHPHEASYLRLDISKARQRLQWVPRSGSGGRAHAHRELAPDLARG